MNSLLGTGHEVVEGRRGIGGHQSASSRTDVWLTPPEILRALGPFDLDPCACPEPRPWPTAATHWVREDGPLNRPWLGRVWLNPPYGTGIVEPWLHRMAEHQNGMAILFARTETAVFHETVWQRGSAILFLRGRPHFYRADGRRAAGNSGGPVCLVAFGAWDRAILSDCGLEGRYLDL